MNNKTVNLLWTSGWDSTFRLLELVLVQGRKVQPYYVNDRKRLSAPVEMKTMEKIKQAIAIKSREARDLIAETIVIDAKAAPEYDDITESFKRLKAASFIGYQYDFLSRMARYRNLKDLELSVHIDDKLYKHLMGNIHEVDKVYELVENPSNPDLEILRCFRFPILMLTKLDMQKRAREQGYGDILELSWFCFHPDSKGRPCGYCNPCRCTIDEGMGRRVPWQGHVRRALTDIVAPANKVLVAPARRALGSIRRRLLK
jgi:7-cyano-7-deazaguanine synthase in queuosine biosynthesis